MNKQIKNLLIDFGGVLIDLDRSRCIDRFRQLGLGEVESLLDVFHQQGVFMQQEKGLITPAEFRDELRALTAHPISDKEIDDAWNSFLVDIPDYKLELLLKLRTQYKVFLLSNTNYIHWKWSCNQVFSRNGHQVNDFFDRVYLSYAMKMAKPDAEIFEAVLEDMAIDPTETLFIDDSPANCLTANALGFATYTPQAGEDWSHLFQ